MLNWALKYARIGLSVIPLRPRGKEPLIPWTEFQHRIASEEEIKKWFAQWPTANIGIVTGAISTVAVVDLDGEEGIRESERLSLNSTVISLTGNGKHLWYSMPSSDVSNAVRVYPGIDIRAEGGYVVAPPSISPNGKRYRWLNPIALAIFGVFLPLFPVVVFGAEKSEEKKIVKEQDRNRQRLDIAKALQEMKDGNIDNTLTAILGRMRRDGYSANDARILLQPHADRVGAEDGHLDEKIENIWNRYEASPKYQMEGQMRLHKPYEQSRILSSMVIHSPTNPNSIKQYAERQSNLESGEQDLQTGYPKLDAMLTGGLKSERLFTCAAYTNHGKTNFGIGVAKNLCAEGKSVLYFSTEYTYKKIWQRYIATLKNPERFKEHKFYVLDSFTPSIEQVEEAVTQIKPDVFIFDYIQHVSKEKEKLTEFMKGCQFIQRKYNNQGIILAQLNRTSDWVENGKRVEPRLSMIEGSATIEQASSRVLLLVMTRISPEYNEITGYLAKNDDGDNGMLQFALYKNPYHLEEL